MQTLETPVFEILTWEAAENISVEVMIKAMQTFADQVMQLPGFLHQALYQRENNQWVCTYYWQTEQHAHDSNVAVADWQSFHQLIALIVPETVTIEVFSPLQSAGNVSL